jgi:hypothetical protein
MCEVKDVRYRSLVDLTAMEVWAPRSLVIDLVWSPVAGMRYFAIVRGTCCMSCEIPLRIDQ